MVNELLLNCIVCGEKSVILNSDNIVSEPGIFVRGHYICADCEARIVQLSALDIGNDYNYYVARMKQIWQEN